MLCQVLPDYFGRPTLSSFTYSCLLSFALAAGTVLEGPKACILYKN